MKQKSFRRLLLSPRLHICQILISIFFLGIIEVLPASVFAAPYGRSGFGTCLYQSGCQSSTQVVLPDGLKISVNLEDGQVIPKQGYNVVVTPLNGAGTSFLDVKFYIAGSLLYTAQPDQTGTATWRWQPDNLGDVNLEIIVTGTDNTILSKSFKLIVAQADDTTYAGGDSNGSNDNTPPDKNFAPSANGQLPQNQAQSPARDDRQLTNSNSNVAHIIQKLPKPLVYSFPYVLLTLLALNGILLFLQIQRETLAYRKLQRLYAQNRLIGDAKKALADLIAHYLRTPMAVLANAIDLLRINSTYDTITQPMIVIQKHLQSTIERLITVPAQELTGINALSNTTLRVSLISKLWDRWGSWVAIAIAAAILINFDYLLSDIGNLSPSAVNLSIQIFSFIALAITTIVLLRGRQINRRNNIALQKTLEAEAAINNLRDGLIDDAAASLRSDITKLEELTISLPDNKPAHFIASGIDRFEQVVTKLTFARLLRGGHTSDLPQGINLSQLLPDIATIIARYPSKPGIRVVASNDMVITTPNPELLRYVLGTLIDNAVAYSHDNGLVKIAASIVNDVQQITVTDNGTGVSPDRMSQLFQPFFKAEGVETFSHEGMGFSLYLDKLILQYLGGDITIDSSPDVETTVHISLPIHVMN